MRRWRYNFLRFILLGSVLILGLMNQNADASSIFGDDKDPRVIIVFIDMSGSTNEARRTVYRNAFNKVYKSFREGDRIVVGTITSHSYIDFKPAVDEELPESSIWVNRLKFEQELSGKKKKVRNAVNRLLKQKRGTPYTEILNSLNIADTIFHNEKKRQKILVIFSDMIQDSKEYKFDKVRITNKYISNVIENRKRQKMIPNLSNVKIYVAGAAASSSKRFRAIELFWTHYFKACKADFSTHRYGHSLLEFEKGL